MSQQEETVKFRYVPCIFFRCIRCGGTIQVEQSLPDITKTGIDCQGCHRVHYQVLWGICPEETEVVVKMQW